ncbi:MAG: bifunctional 23S rRNA (guanine(2069)-N(7))-methyltransferase RlmK/23S rRNA (guanine(2445)-N(2))-methyltransferase RlmL, partial [Eggerthellaceae bacterium]|nr:bifunctional 23S rRNA (guanine(2069)-N(7))-methyltransferase RlmK/23S rRNA (guanine(2445)-N(2))-methyltransferase RlmL [Eggerthellaceae bacterium]
AIEAAMVAADMAPGLLQDYWGFTGWAGHDPALWERLLDEADERLVNGLVRMPREPHIFGSDIDGDAIALAQANAKRAGLGAHIVFTQRDASQLFTLPGLRGLAPAFPEAPKTAEQAGGESLGKGGAAAGLIAVNPPYGQRLSTPAGLAQVYAALAEGLEGLEGKWGLSIITPDAAIDQAIGHQPFAVIKTYNGSIDATLRRYRIEVRPRTPVEVHVLESGQAIEVAVKEKNSSQFAARLYKVAKDRRKWASRTGVSSYRVYDGDLPDYAVAIDLFCGAGASAGKTYLSLAEYAPPKDVDEERARRRFDDVVTIAPLVFGIPQAQVFSRQRRREKGGGQYLEGSGSAYHACIEEGGYRFELDLGARIDTGIFLDHRTTRGMIGDMAAGTRFLNLFAYTGTASVYAAGGGAATTTSVDLSASYLAWAQRNMAQNGFSGDEHRFVRADVLEWLDSQRGTRQAFDLVFVDPPTFSNSKAMGKATWSVQRDHAALLKKVAAVLAPGGKVVFSCNQKGFKPDMEAIQLAGFLLDDVSAATIPEDFKRSPGVHRCYILELE